MRLLASAETSECGFFFRALQRLVGEGRRGEEMDNKGGKKKYNIKPEEAPSGWRLNVQKFAFWSLFPLGCACRRSAEPP
jgi:hypothetical protein